MPNDTSAWRVRANYWAGRRALGGHLTLGATDLAFRPHAFERALGGRQHFVVSLRDIVAIEVDRRGAVPRKRLFIALRDGTEAAFLVPDVDRRAADLRRAMDDLS